MNRFDAIRLEALRAVWNHGRSKPKDDPEYDLFRIIRWYSKTFSTPISDVETMAVDDLVRVWWLERYEELAEDERGKLAQEIRRLTQSKEELQHAQAQEDLDEAELFDMQREDPEIAAQLRGVTKPLEEVAKAFKDIAIATTPPNIAMSFDDLDDEPTGLGLLDPVRRK